MGKKTLQLPENMIPLTACVVFLPYSRSCLKIRDQNHRISMLQSSKSGALLWDYPSCFNIFQTSFWVFFNHSLAWKPWKGMMCPINYIAMIPGLGRTVAGFGRQNESLKNTPQAAAAWKIDFLLAKSRPGPIAWDHCSPSPTRSLFWCGFSGVNKT